jgi:hypothetical protein
MNFAGRWTGEIFMTPEQLKMAHNKENPDVSENPNYLRFLDDPNLADEVIHRHLGYRASEIYNIKEYISTKYSPIDLMTYEHNPYAEIDFASEGMALYYTKKLASIYNNDWVAESSIYDLENWTASLTYFFERMRNNPEKQFLIPVDFHH